MIRLFPCCYRCLLFFFVLCSTQNLVAQNFSITGTVSDTAAAPLYTATVTVLKASDSTLLAFEQTDEKGFFKISDIARSDAPYIVRATYVGLAMRDKKLNAPEPAVKTVDVGVLTLMNSTMLREVLIEAQRDPIRIVGDTTEYNASSFKTQPNAVAEDLLKKMPGIEVAKDGTVKAQGEDVKQIFVNGKRYFGTDPKLALQNVEADAIDKVQVYDKKSDQSEFSGIDDGTRDKTINFVLKPGRSQGNFGNAQVGYGTPNDRAQGKGALNHYDKGQQISLLGQANNINQQGFSFQEVGNFAGGMNAFGGGGMRMLQGGSGDNGVPLNFGSRSNGLSTTWAGGLNFNQTFSPKTELNASYFYNNVRRVVEKTTTQTNFLPTRTFNTASNSFQDNQTGNHRLNVRLEQKIDTFTSLIFTANGSMTQTNSLATSQTLNYRGTNQDSLDTQGARNTNGNADNNTWNSSLLLRRKFLKPGRTVSLTLSGGLTDVDRSSALLAPNQYFITRIGTDTTNQTDAQTSKKKNAGAAVSYTEPLGGAHYAELNYSYSYTDNAAERNVYNVKGLTGERTFNTLLSNIYDNQFNYHRAGATYRYVKKSYNFSTGVQFQSSLLSGQSTLIGTTQRTFNNWLPNARFSYDVSRFKRLNLNYETNVQEPSIDQLQPVTDNSDPLNLYRGNDTLQPAYQHQLRLRFSSFNMATMGGFFGFLSARYTHNKIVNSQTVDARSIRFTTPVNVPDDYAVNSSFNYSLTQKSIGVRWSFGPTASYNRSINPINGINNLTERYGYGGTVRADFNKYDWLDISLSSNLSQNLTTYSLQTTPNQTFLNQNHTAEINVTLPKRFRIGSTYDYSIYTSSTGNTPAVRLWSAYISKQLFKNSAGELRFTIQDILNQNVGISRTADVNYIQDERTNALARYAMLTFSYKFRKMKGSNPNEMPDIPENMRRGMRMMRIGGNGLSN